MNICYSFLLSICLLCSGTAYAQDSKPPQRPKLPSWLPQPPERPHSKRLVREPRKPSTSEPVRVPGFPNVLTGNLLPLVIIMDNPCISAGIEYERFITTSGMFSVSLGGYWYKTAFYVSDIDYNTFEGYQAMPAFLYHPLGNTRRVDISVGPCLSLGRYRYEIETRDASGARHSSVTNSSYTALLGQFNLTAHHVKSFVFAMQFSAGAVINGAYGDPGVVQLGVKFGRRF